MDGNIWEFLPSTVSTSLLFALLIGGWRLYAYISKRIRDNKEDKKNFKNEVLEKERVKAQFEKRVSKLEFENEKLKEDLKEHKNYVTKVLDDHKQSVSEDLGFIKESISKITDYIMNNPKR